MGKVNFDQHFKEKLEKIRHQVIRQQFRKQIEKIRDFPEIGKLMRGNRKGTRELYIKPYRLSYIIEGDEVYIPDIYHEDEQ